MSVPATSPATGSTYAPLNGPTASPIDDALRASSGNACVARHAAPVWRVSGGVQREQQAVSDAAPQDTLGSRPAALFAAGDSRTRGRGRRPRPSLSAASASGSQQKPSTRHWARPSRPARCLLVTYSPLDGSRRASCASGHYHPPPPPPALGYKIPPPPPPTFLPFFPFPPHPSARAFSFSVKRSAERGILLVENYTRTTSYWVRPVREFLDPLRRPLSLRPGPPRTGVKKDTREELAERRPARASRVPASVLREPRGAERSMWCSSWMTDEKTLRQGRMEAECAVVVADGHHAR